MAWLDMVHSTDQHWKITLYSIDSDSMLQYYYYHSTFTVCIIPVLSLYVLYQYFHCMYYTSTFTVCIIPVLSLHVLYQYFHCMYYISTSKELLQQITVVSLMLKFKKKQWLYFNIIIWMAFTVSLEFCLIPKRTFQNCFITEISRLLNCLIHGKFGYVVV